MKFLQAVSESVMLPHHVRTLRLRSMTLVEAEKFWLEGKDGMTSNSFHDHC